MLKVAICDDEQIILDQMEKILWEISDTVELEWEKYNLGEELLDKIHSGESFDLILLDIEMGKISGIELADTLRNKLNDYQSEIVFVTSKEQRAKEACKQAPLDFIDKPFKKEDIQNVIDKTIQIKGESKQCFVYIKLKKEYKIPLKDIYYFESKGRKIKIVSSDGEDEFYATLVDLENKLKPNIFIKVHQSFIVNKNHIIQILKNDVLMPSGEKIPVSRNYKKNVK